MGVVPRVGGNLTLDREGASGRQAQQLNLKLGVWGICIDPRAMQSPCTINLTNSEPAHHVAHTCQPSGKAFPLLLLPGEIRNQIYSHLYWTPEPDCAGGLAPLHTHANGNREIDDLLSLMRINRLLSFLSPNGPARHLRQVFHLPLAPWNPTADGRPTAAGIGQLVPAQGQPTTFCPVPGSAFRFLSFPLAGGTTVEEEKGLWGRTAMEIAKEFSSTLREFNFVGRADKKWMEVVTDVMGVRVRAKKYLKDWEWVVVEPGGSGRGVDGLNMQ
ncbi:hypothetical protein B0T25DRAFT_634683 [Lasiosphaeria hispida]|uniref:Uncharacterized protein n=1 Tax=Lasiosphaeria hispida TaxID=260671 RepID=A0AAJ0H8D7_9PEZI|nr:hypothetical protein B0T25DRAFT_634683 [Lasiosphaeria hispida]